MRDRQLKALIKGVVDAAVAESWKGGGDPGDVPLLEAELKLAWLRLERYIEKGEMKK